MRYLVVRAVITNKNIDGDRLSNFEIKIGYSLSDNGKVKPKCGNRQSVGEGRTKSIACSPLFSGQYPLIPSFFAESLTICELEAYAGP